MAQKKRTAKKHTARKSKVKHSAIKKAHRRKSHYAKSMKADYLKLGAGALGVTILTAFANQKLLNEKTEKIGHYVTPMLMSALGAYFVKNKSIATGMYAGSALLIAQNLIKDIAPNSGVAQYSLPNNSLFAGENSVSDPLAGEYMMIEGEMDDTEVFGEDELDEMLGEDSFVVSGSSSDPLA